MKLTPDTLATLFGSVSAVSQILGEMGTLDKATAGTISAIAIALLGYFSNKNQGISK